MVAYTSKPSSASSRRKSQVTDEDIVSWETVVASIRQFTSTRRIRVVTPIYLFIGRVL